MDAVDFKGLVSDQWHVGVVGTELPKNLLMVLFWLLTVGCRDHVILILGLFDVAEDWFRLFCAAIADPGSES